MKKIDLHVHTSFSDGLLSPQEILELAKKNNVKIMAITDHDTFAGYEEAREIVADYQIELLPGVEISTTHKDTDVHILAYFVDVEDSALNQELEKIQQGRFRRAQKIVQKLAEFGLNLSLEKIIKLAGKNDLIGRPHIARAMVDAGFVANKNEAFDLYLADGGKAYYPKPSPDPAKIIQLIKAAGGVSVLAHPQTLGDDALIFDIIAMGIDGLEVFYAKSSYETTLHLDEMALKNGLIRTGGTDFHGDSFDEEIFQVFEAPASVILELKAKHKQISMGD
ncbi:MAG: PHP domain-containing protein [Candidatus Cloacimonadales bacterium]